LAESRVPTEKITIRCRKTLSNARGMALVCSVSVIKYTVFVVIILGLGGVFFLQKKHKEKSSARIKKDEKKQSRKDI
jgi:hypothetical protein